MPSINVDSTIHHREYMDAAAVCELLGVKRATLYAYASRGYLHSAPGPSGTRQRRYWRSEVLRLKARHDARRGHGPVAASALRWGEPVLDSALTEITPDGPRYRGYLALDLVRHEVPFEAVAELLWTGASNLELPRGSEGQGTVGPRHPGWFDLPVGSEVRPASPRRHGPRKSLVEAGVHRGDASSRSSVLAEMMLVVARRAEAKHRGRHESMGDELGRARDLLAVLVSALGGQRRMRGGSSIAERMAGALRLDPGRSNVLRALDAAMVLCADHELNVSSFAARVVASAGADLYAGLAAALGAFSGPLHGGMSYRVEELVSDLSGTKAARRAISMRLERGESIAGFGHPLYPSGDPRGRYLVELANTLARGPADLEAARRVMREVRRFAGLEPNIDFGLYALCRALGAHPEGRSAAALFAIGRVAGWVGHIFEQRQAAFLLRPRARYIGPSAQTLGERERPAQRMVDRPRLGRAHNAGWAPRVTIGPMNLVDRLTELVAFDSQNPTGDDRPICAYLRSELLALGADDVVLETMGRTGYVYAAFGRAPSLLINAHVDTVPANHGYSSDPHALVRSGSRCVGLGAADTKGAIASVLDALSSLRTAGQPMGDVAVLFSGDEELGGLALQAFLRSPPCASLKRAIVCEPTGCRIGSRHRGVASVTARVQGEGGHSSAADRLVNPLAVLCRAGVALEQFGLAQRDSGPAGFRGLCLNVASLEGGRAFNVVPTSATLTASIRPGPGRALAPLLEQLRDIVVRAAAPQEVTWQVPVSNAPFATRDLESFRSLFGPLIDLTIDLPFWSEAALLSEAGIDAVVFGPGHIEQAHAADEYVDVEQLERASVLFRAVLSRRDPTR